MTASGQIFIMAVVIVDISSISHLLLSQIVEFRVGKAAYKKRKKGQSIKEWFFFTRHKEVLPKFLLIQHFILLTAQLVWILLFLYFLCIGRVTDLGDRLTKIMMAVDLTWAGLVFIIFDSIGLRSSFKFEGMFQKTKYKTKLENTKTSAEEELEKEPEKSKKQKRQERQQNRQNQQKRRMQRGRRRK